MALASAAPADATRLDGWVATAGITVRMPMVAGIVIPGSSDGCHAHGVAGSGGSSVSRFLHNG